MDRHWKVDTRSAASADFERAGMTSLIHVTFGKTQAIIEIFQVNGQDSICNVKPEIERARAGAEDLDRV